MNNYGHLADYPYGQLMARVITGAGGGTDTIKLQTGTTGIEDIILAAWLYHDDTGVAKTIGWSFYDGISALTITMETSSLTDYLKVPLYFVSGVAGRTGNAFILPIKADNQRYPQFVVPALTAGKKGYIHAIVLRRYGQAS